MQRKLSRSPRIVGAGALALLAVLAVQSAQAAVATATFQVTATVLKACLVSTPATLAFGSYTPSTGTVATGTTAFNVTCTFGTTYSVGLSPGAGSGATVTTRKMTSPTAPAGNETLSYALFKESAMTTNWDDSTAGTGYTATGLPQPYTIYGAIPIGQYTASPQVDYADTITLTLTY
ncbi:spore coat protein U domain-containing protein [Variovorax paradoxus B4]|uniref:Spore coat protein U domain-containing protein n=1 Tax=Variovorax paradoxus B4 TaxID=1246301 RepID=T1XN08_VARPD|nr:spore coat U domain-containing protein [Variovorax paradoxus]AGU53654.1 spore coat protein U domain-containing protein [Variovorax paradoxus B4]